MDMNNLPPGSLLSYPDPSDFDYAGFLQATENHHPHAGPSSASAPGGYPLIPAHVAAHTPNAPTPLAVFSDSSRVGTPPSSDSNNNSNYRASSVASGDLTRSSGGSALAKQRLERRGHTKSRRGCYNCKRRRIKVRTNEDVEKPMKGAD